MVFKSTSSERDQKLPIPMAVALPVAKVKLDEEGVTVVLHVLIKMTGLIAH